MVRSKCRTVVKSNGVIQYRKPRILSWCANSDGYPTVKLTADGVSERIGVHRLVAITFIPNELSLPEVNHKDLNRWNPSLQNLEWVSHKDNVAYSHDLGSYKKPQFEGKNNPNAKRVFVNELNLFFPCVAECAEYLRVNGYTNGSIMNATSQICKNCRGKIPHYLGLHFEYS